MLEFSKIKFLLTNGKLFFAFIKFLQLVISKIIFQIPINQVSIFVINLILDINLIIALTRFIKLEKLTYTIIKIVNPLFKNFQLIRSDITFFKYDEWAILRLKYSKTNSNHIGILILSKAIKNSICLVIAL